MTVKELITALLEYPMDDEVFVEVNNDLEYEIQGHQGYGYSRRRILLKIEDVPLKEE